MFFILLGAPGAGKGTQADIIVKEMGLPHVASGDLFRQALKDETPLGKQAESYMKAGKLVPDEITIKMILERIAQPDCKNGCVFDGFPRTLEQAKALDVARVNRLRRPFTLKSLKKHCWTGSQAVMSAASASPLTI